MVKLLVVICLVVLASATFALPIDIPITDPLDDGEELDASVWVPDASPMQLGRTSDGQRHAIGLRYHVPQLVGLHQVVYARLRFSARGSALQDSLHVVITGARERSSPPLSSLRRPSLLLQTDARTEQTIRTPWRDSGTSQLFAYSGDIHGIIDEVIGQSGWGQTDPALVLCLVADGATPGSTDYVACNALTSLTWPVTLQVCRTLSETFTAHGLIGRPTAHGATYSFSSLVSLEVYVEYGVGNFAQRTKHKIVPAGQTCEIALTGLVADRAYQCRLTYRLADSGTPFESGPTYHVRTQRPEHSDFTFTTQADAHTWEYWSSAVPQQANLDLYQQVLQNVAADAPDLHFALGDFSMTETARTASDARDHYTLQRTYLDAALHSVPFYLVIGNHEGELGWLRAAGDSVATWAETARIDLIPNPAPDGFYRGCPDTASSGSGLRESYYSFEWGDALFVVLDPYWYTTTQPWHNPVGDGWSWTLGQDQYDWLHDVLATSNRRWKIVLMHQLVGGVTDGGAAYGRGGIEAVKFAVDGRPTYEWGGENAQGADVFATKRPGWQWGPIHDLLKAGGVELVICGHDHFYAFQEWDGIAYVTVPQPADHGYTMGAMADGRYSHGTLLPNAGHVRFRVTDKSITIDYISAFLAGEGVNQAIADRHVLGDEDAIVSLAAPRTVTLQIAPNPVHGDAPVLLRLAGDKATTGPVDLRIYDLAGRLCGRGAALDDGGFLWNQRDLLGQPVPSGVYHCIAVYPGQRATARLVIVR